MPTKNYAKASAAIFDMDGLLLDTEIIYTAVTQEIVGKFGKVFDWSIKSNMIGRPAMDSARYLVEALHLPLTPEQYLQQRESKLQQRCSDCQALPGAESLIRKLHEAAIPIALATSSSEHFYRLKTRHHQSWFSLFDAVITGDNPHIKQGKPAPDIFLLAAQHLNVQPQHALVFEDAPSGLQAGLAAGMRVICVIDENMEQARYENAELILNSLSQFNPQQYFSL